MASTKLLSRLALGATLVLVAIGGFTRGSGSGFGCADRWPLCEDGLLGGLLPRADYHMIIEWTHRWVAAVVGILAIATALSAWRRHRNRRSVLIPAVAAVAVIGVQAWIGRLVVKGDLDADLVSVHLAVSMVVVALLTIVVVTTSRPAQRTEEDRTWAGRLGLAAAASLAVLLLGSYVHNLYIGGWPLVGNTLFPDLSNRFVAVHFLHRLVAGVVFFYLGWLVFASRRARRPGREQYLVVGAAGLYAVNIALGAAHVFTRVGSSVLVAAHLLVAALVWTLLVGAAVGARDAATRPGPAREASHEMVVR